MPGIIIPPIATTVAGPEPEIAAKNIQAHTVTIASPPAFLPKRELKQSTRRREIPPLPINSPAKQKSGIANKEKLLAPLTNPCTT